MVQPVETVPEVQYPDSDGQPMADNTKQFRWIVTVKENLELLFADRADVFVAGDLLWYPVQGDNKIRQAPDAMVVFGRPKGDRGSYKQWEEDNIAPQVVFEILSPGNRLRGTFGKYEFYNFYGVEEYYVYDPDENELIGWLRSNNALNYIQEMSGWISPRLEVRFELTPETLRIYRPDGEPFLSFIELSQLRNQERQRAEEAQRLADQALNDLDLERRRNELMAEKLRELGIDSNNLS
jgi:Uma2 family endonuclease